MLVKMQCSNCGAELNVDDSKQVFFCTHCGTKVMNVAERVEVNQNISIRHINENADNVSIVFTSLSPSIKLVTKVPDIGREDVFNHGEERSFRLNIGWHVIEFNTGWNVQKREIYIREDNAPVKISVSYTNVWNVSVAQPIIPDDVINERQAECERLNTAREAEQKRVLAERKAYIEAHRKNSSGIAAIVLSSISLIATFIAKTLFKGNNGLNSTEFLFVIFVLVTGVILFLIATILGFCSIKNIVKKIKGWVASIVAFVLIIVAGIFTYKTATTIYEWATEPMDEMILDHVDEISSHDYADIVEAGKNNITDALSGFSGISLTDIEDEGVFLLSRKSIHRYTVLLGEEYPTDAYFVFKVQAVKRDTGEPLVFYCFTGESLDIKGVNRTNLGVNFNPYSKGGNVSHEPHYVSPESYNEDKVYEEYDPWSWGDNTKSLYGFETLDKLYSEVIKKERQNKNFDTNIPGY